MTMNARRCSIAAATFMMGGKRAGRFLDQGGPDALVAEIKCIVVRRSGLIERRFST